MKPSGTILEQLDTLYAGIRGSPYANSLNEARKAFAAKDYPEALRCVRGAADIYRRSHLATLRQDPAGVNKKDAEWLRGKQAKIQGMIDGFDALVERLERMAKLKVEKPEPPPVVRPRPPQRPATVEEAREETPVAGPTEVVTSTIDAGTFTQLQTAAQQTGLVPNADTIGFVREHEFRVGKYREAFDRIEAVYQQLRAAADQRQQKIRQDTVLYKSGVLKMSPKDWMQRVQRETAQSQVIDRAIRYFLRVLDGLRILVASENRGA